MWAHRVLGSRTVYHPACFSFNKGICLAADLKPKTQPWILPDCKSIFSPLLFSYSTAPTPGLPLISLTWTLCDLLSPSFTFLAHCFIICHSAKVRMVMYEVLSRKIRTREAGDLGWNCGFHHLLQVLAGLIPTC